MKILGLMSCFAVSVMLASCGKEDGDTPSNPSNPSDDGAKRLEWMDDYYYERGNERNSSLGDFVRLAFSYEDGRLKRLSSNDIDGNPGEYYEFVYEDGKTSAIKLCDAAGIVHESYIFQYDGGILTRAIFSFNGKTNTYSYEYNAAGELVKRSCSSSDGEQAVIELTWENGNVVKVVEWYNGSLDYNAILMSYDDKPNAMQVAADLSYILDASGPCLSYMSRNNVVEYRYQSADGSESTEPQSLSYDGDYVITQRRGDNDGYFAAYLHYSDGTGATSPQMCRITASCSGLPGGYVYVNGLGEYAVGNEVTLLAHEYVEDDGNHYQFERWSDGNTNHVRTFAATGDAHFQAIYVPSY